MVLHVLGVPSILGLPATGTELLRLMKLQSIRGCIVAALSVGVPLYNRGDPQGCFEAYAKAASECLAYSSAPALKESTSRIQATLSRALDLTSAQSSAEERAWTMRRALDTVLEEIAATESPRPTSSANQPQVQPWPLDFTRQDAADAWMAVDDRIMGGSSRSRVVFDKGVSVFEGELIEQGGGFASVRCARLVSIQDVEALRLKVKSDGRVGYKLTLMGDHAPRISYQILLDTADEAVDADGFADLELPLDEFMPSFQGRPLRDAPPLRDAKICSLGLMLSQFAAGGGEVADKRRCPPGNFRIELKQLAAGKSELAINGRRWV